MEHRHEHLNTGSTPALAPQQGAGWPRRATRPLAGPLSPPSKLRACIVRGKLVDDWLVGVAADRLHKRPHVCNAVPKPCPIDRHRWNVVLWSMRAAHISVTMQSSSQVVPSIARLHDEHLNSNLPSGFLLTGIAQPSNPTSSRHCMILCTEHIDIVALSQSTSKCVEEAVGPHGQ